MNWKKYPHLFANGMFSVQFGTTGRFDIIGVYYNYIVTLEWGNIRLDQCTLVARKIEDMTDEEVKEMYSIPGNSVESLKQMRDFTEMKANKGNLKFSEAIYLLSKGIYPFDQSHFEDGTVIDRSKNPISA